MEMTQWMVIKRGSGDIIEKQCAYMNEQQFKRYIAEIRELEGIALRYWGLTQDNECILETNDEHGIAVESRFIESLHRC